jgi:dinuclear metal center YbgI/SA1388 family protein
MKISEITAFLETLAPPSLQENYDNAGLITGEESMECTGILCCLDATEPVIDEAIDKGCNLVVAHHPIVFSGLKKLNGKSYVERVVIKALKNDICIYAIHTNLDNVLNGVNQKIAEKIGLQKPAILLPKKGQLKKLYYYVPSDYAEKVMNAVFQAGAGHIGQYSECSFSAPGSGTFKPEAGANPFVGETGSRHVADELKTEILFPAWREREILSALKANHPYEEVAYEIISLDNDHQQLGSGVLGELPEPMDEPAFLSLLKENFGLAVIRHTAFRGKKISKVAVCGGAGSFLIGSAIRSGSDIYITSDLRYHEFFDANDRIILADIGHFESEQFTIELLATHLEKKFLNFAVLKTGVNTNPVNYF